MEYIMFKNPVNKYFHQKPDGKKNCYISATKRNEPYSTYERLTSPISSPVPKELSWGLFLQGYGGRMDALRDFCTRFVFLSSSFSLLHYDQKRNFFSVFQVFFWRNLILGYYTAFMQCYIFTLLIWNLFLKNH